MAITINNIQSAIDQVTSSSTATLNYTPSSVPNSVLAVIVTYNPSGDSLSGVTFGGTPLTFVSSADNTPDISVAFYYLLNPSTTAANVVASFTGDVDYTIAVMTLSGVNQTTPVLSSIEDLSGPNADVTVDLPSTTSGSFILGMYGALVPGGATVGGGQTEVFENNNGFIGCAVSYESGTGGTVTTSWTLGNGRFWGVVAVEFNPSTPPTFTQEGYRWRNDDGSETTATWKASQDTTTTVAINSGLRIRVLIDTSGNTDTSQFQLEFKKVGDTEWRKIN